MSFNAVLRWRHRRFGFNPPRPMLRPTVGSGLVISWAGMRGIVSLAAAMALPAAFPYRDLIVLTAFSVVLGTLTIQGLTLKPLLRALNLHDDDPVGREVSAARERALGAGLATFANDRSALADAVRQEFKAHLAEASGTLGSAGAARSAHADIRRGALQAARQTVIAMRDSDEIGDDAFHLLEEELDWLEMADAGGRNEVWFPRAGPWQSGGAVRDTRSARVCSPYLVWQSSSLPSAPRTSTRWPSGRRPKSCTTTSSPNTPVTTPVLVPIKGAPVTSYPTQVKDSVRDRLRLESHRDDDGRKAGLQEFSVHVAGRHSSSIVAQRADLSPAQDDRQLRPRGSHRRQDRDDG